MLGEKKQLKIYIKLGKHLHPAKNVEKSESGVDWRFDGAHDIIAPFD